MAKRSNSGTPVSDYTALLSGFSWNNYETVHTTAQPTFITYSFPTTIRPYDALAFKSSAKHWRPFSATDIKDAKAALRQWGEASGITFLEVAPTSPSDIEFSWLPGASSAFAQYPSTYNPYPSQPDEYTEYVDYGGSIYLNTGYKKIFKNDPKFKKYILLHEIGHALGLKHSFSTEKANDKVLKHRYDSAKYTVMSYKHSKKYPGTKLGILDKQAIQALYGAPDQDGRQAASFSWDPSTETLTQEGWQIDDRLRGTAVKDVLIGKDGSDRLQGFAGDDSLLGGAGNDVLIGGPGRDSFRFGTQPAESTGFDRIVDFDTANDRIVLSGAVFTELGSSGQLSEAAFAAGSRAADPSDRIVFDYGYTNSLYYDPDGNGARPQIKIAMLNHVTLGAHHFLIV